MQLRSYLSIESSCDETALSVLQAEGVFSSADASPRLPAQPSLPARVRVLAHVVESQHDSHQPFGGVVPEVAARDHLAKIHPLAQAAIARSGLTASDLDGIVVTLGPGLIGALMVGVLFARGLAQALNVPVLGVNHVHAHLAPALLLPTFSPSVHLGVWCDVPETPYPALALTVSGGHCHLSRLDGPAHRTLLGRTADDACGEAFDKVAKLLGCAYPGGPELEALARTSMHARHSFPATLADRANRWGFSFSGLKTAALEAVRKETGQVKGKISGAALDAATKADIASAFQEAALGQLVDRVRNALVDLSREERPPRILLVAGGVAANARFRALLSELPIPVRCAPLALCSDNATMIGLQAFIAHVDGSERHPFPRYDASARP